MPTPIRLWCATLLALLLLVADASAGQLGPVDGGRVEGFVQGGEAGDDEQVGRAGRDERLVSGWGFEGALPAAIGFDHGRVYVVESQEAVDGFGGETAEVFFRQTIF